MSGRDMVSKEFEDLLQAVPAWQERLAACSTVRHDLQYADHTFSSSAWRDQVLEWGIEWLTRFTVIEDSETSQPAR
jgi:hypothetical protein